MTKAIDALNRHGFEASYVTDRHECRRLLVALIPPSASVGVPGSASVRATGIVAALRERGQPGAAITGSSGCPRRPWKSAANGSCATCSSPRPTLSAPPRGAGQHGRHRQPDRGLRLRTRAG
ncbi:MAG: LUD domain-containing protein [Desulfosudis oleivorans]|nr:LUD domain-containing protein [Desulfosudis oleivorans]